MQKSKEIAEICAAIIGDGWIESSEKGLYLTGHPIDDKEYYDFHMAPLFTKNFIKVKPKLYPYWKVYGFGTYKKKIITRMINLGVKKGHKANTVTFPNWIFSKKEFMISALRGIFDTDGNFHCKKCYGKYDNKFRKKYHCQPRILINSTSKRLIFQIIHIMKKLELHPERIKTREKNFSGGKNNKESYFVKLNKLNEIKLWFEELKLSSNKKHISKYLVWKRFGFCPPMLTPSQRENILSNKICPHSYYE
jgi:intein/homing endonuclease